MLPELAQLAKAPLSVVQRSILDQVGRRRGAPEQIVVDLLDVKCSLHEDPSKTGLGQLAWGRLGPTVGPEQSRCQRPVLKRSRGMPDRSEPQIVAREPKSVLISRQIACHGRH